MVSLRGKTIALLRAQGQGGELASGFRELGATVLEVPLIAIAPPLDETPLLAAARAIATFDWVALTSPNAVAALVRAVAQVHGDASRSLLLKVPSASVGPGTSRSCVEHGVPVSLEATDSLQEGLARALIARGLATKRVLLPRADQARDALERALVAAGADVTAVTAYRTIEGQGDVSVLTDALAAGSLAAICFTSASTARHLARRIEPRRWLTGPAPPLLASMGPIASAALRELGVEPGVEAREHTAEGLVATVAAALGNDSTRRDAVS